MTALTSEALLPHWQGHRRLTRRIIEAFPEDKMYSFSLGGMRPFSDLAMEFISIAVPAARGVATDAGFRRDGDFATRGDSAIDRGGIDSLARASSSRMAVATLAPHQHRI